MIEEGESFAMIEETKKRTMLEVIDEIFTVFENVRSMLCAWTAGYHTSFIYEVKRVQKLEIELNNLGYDDDFVSFVLEHVYNTFFVIIHFGDEQIILTSLAPRDTIVLDSKRDPQTCAQE